MSIAIFIPVRKGSERVKDKNTRPFANYQDGLLELKLKQFLGFNEADEIILSSNDEYCLEIAQKFSRKIPNLKIDERPDSLANSNTPLSDLIYYIPKITKCENILWTHVTSPFCLVNHYKNAIKKYQSLADFDSLFTGLKFQEYLWNARDHQVINNKTRLSWPRTQDLDENFLLNNAIFVAKREAYLNGNRIGEKPFLFEMDKIASWDIDTEIDFEMAEALYGRFFK